MALGIPCEEIISACAITSRAMRESTVFALSNNLSTGVVNSGQLTNGVIQGTKLKGNRLAGFNGILFGNDFPLRVRYSNGGRLGTDDLIADRVAFFHLDDVRTGGQAGDGHSAVCGSGDTIGGKTVEDQAVRRQRGASYRYNRAAFRRKGVGSSVCSQIIENIVFGIQNTLIKHHVGLDSPVSAYCYHNNTCVLGPNGGEEGGCSHGGTISTTQSQSAVHGVIGDQNDGGALFIGSHCRNGTVVFIGHNGKDITFLAIDPDHLIVNIRKSCFIVADTFDRMPVTEYVKFESIASIHGQPALGIGIEVNVSNIKLVFGEITNYGI